MTPLYNFGINCYSALLAAVSPFNIKAKQWCEGRKNIFAKLSADFVSNTAPVAWFHAASLGEFEQGRAVIELFKAKNPHYKILVTFYSPSGYEVRKNYSGADYIYYLPSDTSGNVRRFLDIVKPKVAVFIKYEFWKNYLLQCKERGVKTYLISAIFREKQLFFKPYGGSYRKILGCFDHLFVQNDKSKELLASIGIDNVTVCGDTRFDRVYQIAQEAQEIELFKNFSNNNKVFIVGSSWEPDDKITLKLIEKFQDVKFIIAPHELGKAKIAKLKSDIEALSRKVVLYTSLDKECTTVDCDVIIIDTIGILSKVYRYATYSYIGGGFGVGIHNTLEAATFGLPMIFGPKYQKFSEAIELVALGVATPISNEDNAINWLYSLIEDGNKYDTLRTKCLAYVEQNIGVGETIVNHPLI